VEDHSDWRGRSDSTVRRAWRRTGQFCPVLDVRRRAGACPGDDGGDPRNTPRFLPSSATHDAEEDRAG